MGCEDEYDLSKKLGNKWAYKYKDAISTIDQVVEENNKTVPF